MALFDCMIFSLTLYKSFGWHLTGLNLFTVLLRDGTSLVFLIGNAVDIRCVGSIYFGYKSFPESSGIADVILSVIVILNLSNILTFVVSGPTHTLCT
jgi:hypothetical protein